MLTTSTRKLFEAETLTDDVRKWLERKEKANETPVRIADILRQRGAWMQVPAPKALEDALWALRATRGHDRDIVLLNTKLAERGIALLEARGLDTLTPLKALETIAELLRDPSENSAVAATSARASLVNVFGKAVWRRAAGGSVEYAVLDAVVMAVDTTVPGFNTLPIAKRMQHAAADAASTQGTTWHMGRNISTPATAGMAAANEEEKWQRACFSAWLDEIDQREGGA